MQGRKSDSTATSSADAHNGYWLITVWQLMINDQLMMRVWKRVLCESVFCSLKYERSFHILYRNLIVAGMHNQNFIRLLLNRRYSLIQNIQYIYFQLYRPCV